jgi:hypothetical protein
MTTQLNVLLLESQTGVGHDAAEALSAAGHRVHRCFDGVPESFAYPCTAMTKPGSCPLDGDVDVDVALLVRHLVTAPPTGRERGVSCAVRAGVPVVEQGGDALDDFGPWVDRRVGPSTDVVTACEAAAEDAAEPVRSAVLENLRTLLQGVGVAPEDVRCRLAVDGTNLGVHLDLPVEVGTRVEHALGVRTLDAVRAGPRSYGQVRVFVHHPAAAG